MKQEINVLDYTTEIIKALSKGILLTTKANGRVNTMTIAWGMFGIEWQKPIFTALVRKGRFTTELLNANPEFTVNIPVGDFDTKILGLAGSKSGRDVDKVKALNLTLEKPEIISVPGIKELPLTLECKVIYKQEQDKNCMLFPNVDRFYPQDVPSTNCGSNKDFHVAYYGEIVKAYIIKD